MQTKPIDISRFLVKGKCVPRSYSHYPEGVIMVVEDEWGTKREVVIYNTEVNAMKRIVETLERNLGD